MSCAPATPGKVALRRAPPPTFCTSSPVYENVIVSGARHDR
ncbi:MAG TPA: hypothetical protein VGV12_16715 [Gemmatimonadales bacterium]|nr:hypothetical protein [Gemmatimonadales bacterium]